MQSRLSLYRCEIEFLIHAGDLDGPPDKPLPSEPPTYMEPCTSPPFTTSTSVTDVIEEQNVPLLADINSDDSSEDPSSSLNSCTMWVTFYGDGCDLYLSIYIETLVTTVFFVRSQNRDSVRRRREERVEKNERLATQVRDMKRRQRDCENWQKFKRSLCKPLTIGICIGIGGGIILGGYYLYMRS